MSENDNGLFLLQVKADPANDVLNESLPFPTHEMFLSLSSLLSSLVHERDTCARLTQIGSLQRTFQMTMKASLFHSPDTCHLIDHLQDSFQIFLSYLQEERERERAEELRVTLSTLMDVWERAVNGDTSAYEPSNYGESVPNFAERMASRHRAVEELVITEKNYLIQLTELDTLFIAPLRKEIESGSVTPTVDKKGYDGMFNFVTTILKIVQDHYPSMEQVLSTAGNPIGSAFLKICPWFKHYTAYIYQFDESAKKIQDLRKNNPKLSKFFREAEKRSTINYDLSSYMILPVQRLGRYEMLLKRIIEFTPRTHPDYISVKSALSNVYDINRQINEYKRAGENRRSIENLSKKFAVPPKPPLDGIKNILIFDGPAWITYGKGVPQKPNRVSHLILFQDSVMICKVTHDGKYEKKQSFPISGCKLMAVTENGKNSEHPLGLVDGSKVSHFFYFESANVRTQWMKRFRELGLEQE